MRHSKFCYEHNGRALEDSDGFALPDCICGAKLTAVIDLGSAQVRPIDHSGAVALQIEGSGQTVVLTVGDIAAAIDGAGRLGHAAHRLVEMLHVRRGDKYPLVDAEDMRGSPWAVMNVGGTSPE